MKKLMTFALPAVMVLSLAACGQSVPQPEKTAEESNVEIPNPFTAYDTMEVYKSQSKGQFSTDGRENRLTKKYLTHIIKKDFYVES